MMVLKPAEFFGEPPQVEIEDPNHATLEIAVADRLAMSGGIDAADVEVTADRGAITLSGTVATEQEIDRAAEIARAVSGVASVVNRIVTG